MTYDKRWRTAIALLAAGGLAEAVLIRLGQTYGSTPAERRLSLLGDDIVPGTRMVTNHAITIDAPPTASGHGLCRWDGIAPAGTPLAGSTSCSFRSTGRAPTGSFPSYSTSSSGISSPTVLRKPSVD